MEKIKIDFSGVEERSGGITPGKYLAVVKAITKEPGTKAPYLKWDLQITSGGCKGLHINHITSLSVAALFRLRDTLTALGFTVPKAAINIEPDKLIGKTLGIEVNMRPVDGEEYPNVKNVFRPSDLTTSSAKESAPVEDDDEPSLEL